MNLDRRALDVARACSIVTRDQADALSQLHTEHGEDATRFSFAQGLYYLGGLVAIGAMTLFMTGILWQRHETTIAARLRAWLRTAMRELIQRRGA